ncbi:acyl transferase [Vibrio orientalis CIP 102891 = ATCC 33934]|uniref:Acyl transferase n=3 Tax=Vibrio orientalis TaxID=28175 RepID=C9QDX8_VIBOR|nr:acyl transferase [Vibrio orientalis]ACB59268.1 acyl transferase [Vibrio orientalis CIP 102891 = ATCC 33934]EEX94118.1 acyl transferase LuxD [Vibrio orientalis CIP 102891 = ATCC 33934]EGU44568.1 acyl transferase [Vibrio orientalis CIP 102891 = ATCC 33934]
MSNRCKTIAHVLRVNNGQEIHVWETPPKENAPSKHSTILIASGFARRMDHFAGLAEYLSENGFHVFRYDSLHHVGLSSGSIDEFTMTTGKNSLCSVYHWLQTKGTQNIGLIAASLSARVAYEVVSDLELSFLITAVGVVNLRDTLEKALSFDYLSLPINELPNDLDFEGHKLGSEVFVRDCFEHHWDTFDSTLDKVVNTSVPLIAFTANNDDWVKQEEVYDMLAHIRSGNCKLYSLLGSSHDLGENLVVLRNFYQSVTKAAIAMDGGSLEIDVDFIEPDFEQLTTATVNERRLKAEIESRAPEMA